ncbi:hypothetical protein NFI96_012907, partial [Prochilodus magdalenae]
ESPDQAPVSIPPEYSDLSEVFNKAEDQALEQYIREALAQGYICRSTPAATSKKKDSGLRPCIDYRGLNLITKPYHFHLLLVPVALEQLSGATVFTKLDLRSAYNLVKVREGDGWKTACLTTRGHYKYLAMPFELRNALSVFQAFINDVLRDMIGRIRGSTGSVVCFVSPRPTNTPDANVELPGFSRVRADRDPTLSEKCKGGGLALFINTRWCNPGHVNVKEVFCCQDIELLVVSLGPYYMPQELSHAIVICVYIPPRADMQAACDIIHSTVAALQTQHPDAFYVISGDFNHMTLDSTLPAFFQFVDCPTRKNRTIDLLYANVRDAYRAAPLPPLRKSDHNLVFLQPQYKPLVLRQPTTTRSIQSLVS